MPRALLFSFVGLTVVACAALLAAGCLDSMPMTPDGGQVAPVDHPPPIRAAALPGDTTDPDGGDTADLLPPPPPDLSPSDLTGLTNCYGHAYCDSTNMFCLRFIGGSPGKPGAEKLAPSCYSPNDACPNGTLDCNCIQQDAVLGPACAECFDNKDGTFTCYAQ